MGKSSSSVMISSGSQGAAGTWGWDIVGGGFVGFLFYSSFVSFCRVTWRTEELLEFGAFIFEKGMFGGFWLNRLLHVITEAIAHVL